MNIKEIFKFIGGNVKKAVDDPSFSTNSAKFIKGIVRLGSKNAKTNTREKDEIDRKLDQYLKDAPKRKEKYIAIHTNVVNFINENISENKYSVNKITGDLDYSVLKEASKILSKEDYEFYEKSYNRYHCDMKSFEDALKAFIS